MLWRASLGGAVLLIVGRVFGAGREFYLAHQVGPTDEMAAYVLASSILLAVAGLASGVTSALVVRRSGPLRQILFVAIVAGLVPVIAVIIFGLIFRPSYFMIFFVFAISVPFYAVYGVANGRLLVSGSSFFGMLMSILPAVTSTSLLLIPIGSLVERAGWGNFFGAFLMAFLTVRRSRSYAGAYVFNPGAKVVVQSLALTAVSAINIASPIVDRFFASRFGPQDLVLLNLGAILYIGATTSLGLAMGNAAVSRDSVSAPGFSIRSLTLVPLAVASIFLLGTPLFAGLVLSGGDYSPDATRVLLGICFVYALATPCAILNQIHMRLWNRTARSGSMMFFAAVLLSLNVALNFVYVSYYGVVGIAVATFSVQVVQAVVLGFLRSNTVVSVIAIAGTIFLGGILVACS